MKSNDSGTNQHDSISLFGPKEMRPFHQLGNKSSDDGITAGDGTPQESDIDSYSIYKISSISVGWLTITIKYTRPGRE